MKEKLTRIFRDVFDDDSVEISGDMTAEDIEDWDSIMHLTLITEIERKFKMKFKMKEITGMKDVGELIDIISQRAHGEPNA